MRFRRTSAVIAGLTLLGVAPSPSFGDLALSISDYDVSFPGGSYIHLKGASTSIGLTLGVPSAVYLDGYFNEAIAPGADFTADASGTITLGGISQSFSDSYTLRYYEVQTPHFSGGPPIVFHFGAFDVTATPIDSTGTREATFLETQPTLLAAVPEPSSLLAVAVAAGAVAIRGVARRMRRRPAPRHRSRNASLSTQAKSAPA